ncbi:5-demethoxyubiquinone hydroxylase, mitochondrial [Eurytemora carolleeae]|uniref:5-demethoxyubiquinone hydroxylase, mitochondrial n=1 Tax=Eurytemora carolleeae TaxID=1294199 RepID=UPI000C794D17|nr:5-demethoxyubiquinone hydroxylase, mitochondrial [Eurytemora carolleeae]|eukprot:XP_023321425.1 5-demethoxyubiquinone hydroxylase, mitochondrial-like [Eurytemora affinis]
MMYSLSTLGRRSSGLVRLPLEVLWTRARYISSSERAALDRAKIDSMIRVDHAGEYGADRIYAGQLAVLGHTDIGPKISEMWEQEKEHLATFNRYIPEYRVRPTALLPLWHVAGYALGAGTALLGKEAAMACTVAVEASITAHYNEQLRELHKDGDKYEQLIKTISKFRDDEQEHHDTGLEHGAEQAPAYALLSAAITVGCKGAIWLSERV